MDDGPRQHVFGPQIDAQFAAFGVAGQRRVFAVEDLRTDAQAAALQRGRQCVDAAHEVGHEERGWVAIDLQRAAHLLDATLVHDDDAVGHREGFFLVVRDHDRGHAQRALQAADFTAQLDALNSVQRRQRLVQQQQPRLGGQRTRQRNALLLPARQLRRVLGLAARQAHQGKKLVNAFGHRAARHLAIDEAIGHVLSHVQVREKRVGLEHDAVVALCRRQAGDVAPGQFDAAGGLHLQPRDDAQQCGLAAAAGAQEADEFALRDVEVDALQRAEAAEVLADAGQPQVRSLRPHRHFFGSLFAL